MNYKNNNNNNKSNKTMLKENLYSMSEGIAEYSRAKLYKD